MKGNLFLVIIIGFIMILCNQVYATTITYDLANPGGTQWEYTYSVTNDSMSSAIEEFTIYFNPGLYANLIVGNTPADWDAIPIQPDPALPDDGFYDALTLATGIAPGATVSGFSVSFDWLVAGIPGSQLFDVFDPITFDVLDSGTTVAATSVPEPGILPLLGLALTGIIGIGKKLRIKV